ERARRGDCGFISQAQTRRLERLLASPHRLGAADDAGLLTLEFGSGGPSRLPDKLTISFASLGRGRRLMKIDGTMPHERLPFSGTDDRPPLRFPNGVRTVVWPVLALEVWDISRPMARMIIPPPQGQPMLPDHPNWSWHEYGMRVGFWRI